MSLREKHIADQNRMAKRMSIVILASMLIITVLAFIEQIRPDMIFRLIVLIAAMTVNIVGCRVFQTSEIYRHMFRWLHLPHIWHLFLHTETPLSLRIFSRLR